MAIYEFGPYRLDGERFLLWRDGQPAGPHGRSVQLLEVLLRHHGQTVTHQRLLEEVWRGLIVTMSNVHVHVSRLRKAFANDPGIDIITVANVGYRLVADVRRLDEDPPRRARPRLAVIGDAPASLPAAPSSLELALIHCLSSQLARHPELELTSQTAANEAVASERARRAHRISDWLRVSLLPVESEWQLHLELIDAEQSTLRFARSVQGPLAVLMTISEDMADEVAIALELDIRAEHRCTGTLLRDEQVLARVEFARGLLAQRELRPAGLLRAAQHFEHAVAAEPIGRHAALAIQNYLLLWHWSAMPAKLALEAAQRHLPSLDDFDDDPDGRAARAMLATATRHAWDEGESLFREVLAAHPRHAMAHQWLGHLLDATGRFDEAREHFLHFHRLEPSQPLAELCLGLPDYYAGDFARAHRAFMRCARLYPALGMARLIAGACAALGGDPASGRALAEAELARGEQSALALALLALSDPQQADHCEERLREVGAPRLALAVVQRARGDRAALLESVEQLVRDRDPGTLALGSDPLWWPLHGEARFQELLGQHGVGHLRRAAAGP